MEGLVYEAHTVKEEDNYRVEYYPNHQTAARAARNVFAVAHVAYRNFKAVAAGTRVVVDLEGLIVEAILDFDLVVQVDVFVRHVVGV